MPAHIDIASEFLKLAYKAFAGLKVEFRLPEIGEEVVVQHGFMRRGVGIVKEVSPDSPTRKVVVTVTRHGKPGDLTGPDGPALEPFDVPYTYKGGYFWECVEGEHRISSGAMLGTYTGPSDDPVCDASKLVVLAPPTEASRQKFASLAA